MDFIIRIQEHHPSIRYTSPNVSGFSCCFLGRGILNEDGIDFLFPLSVCWKFYHYLLISHGNINNKPTDLALQK